MAGCVSGGCLRLIARTVHVETRIGVGGWGLEVLRHQVKLIIMEPQIVLKIDNNHTLKASNFKIFLGACPQTPLAACDYRISVLMSTPNNFYPHTPMDTAICWAKGYTCTLGS